MGTPIKVLGLDFETYSARNIKDGQDAYMADDTFCVLIASVKITTQAGPKKYRYQFNGGAEGDGAKELRTLLHSYRGKGWFIAAHNAPFELGCLDWLGIKWDARFVVDTAVIARAYGADSKLELAAPQMLGRKKVDMGRKLIKLFSMPGKFQEANGNDYFDWDIVGAHSAEWKDFFYYCDVDAELCEEIAMEYSWVLRGYETYYNWLTHNMNQVGWQVDVPLVKAMQVMAEKNRAKALLDFYAVHQPNVEPNKRLNFNSPKQIKEFALANGIRSKSFDEEHVEKLLVKINARINKGGLTPAASEKLSNVRHMLEVKRTLGGSSLKKLDKILSMVGPGDRLRGQYMHCGAGQTLRTSGRGVQMQNLKRLGADIDDVNELLTKTWVWTNDLLARNIRQCFTASYTDGQLLVGDFASVESRGLAYEAGAKWKVDAFKEGKDMYKVLASKMYGVPYEAVTKEQRQVGKVGELACGYGAGPGAVQRFASKMGVEFTEEEARDLVVGWRQTNPEIVALWDMLSSALISFVQSGRTQHVSLANDLEVRLAPIQTPKSLAVLHKEAQSMEFLLVYQGDVVMKRYFHGLYMRGRDVCHWKASENYGGELWKNHYLDPQTGEVRFYKLYGGKLTGIMTQSLCRELFFESLVQLEIAVRDFVNVQIIGQFHDEIVVDWHPHRGTGGKAMSHAGLTQVMAKAMSSPFLDGFPLVGEIKSDYRYTK